MRVCKFNADHCKSGSTDLEVMLSAQGERGSNIVSGIHISSSDADFVGTLQITEDSGATVLYKQYITAGGLGPLPLTCPMRGSHNKSMSIKLVNTSGSEATLNVLGVYTE